MRKRHNCLIADVALLLGSLVITFLVLEAATRLMSKAPDRLIEKDNSPFEMMHGGVPRYYHIDEHLQRTELDYPDLYGYPGDEIIYHERYDLYDPCPPEDRLAILLLGDSVTMGGGIPPEDFMSHSFNALLQERIDNYSGHGKAKVMTLAQGGYNLVQIERSYREFLVACKPDIVIYGFFQNDLNTNHIIRDESGRLYMAYSLEGHTPMLSGVSGRLLGRSALISKIDSLAYRWSVLRDISRKARDKGLPSGNHAFDPLSMRPTRQEESFLGIIKASEEAGVDLIVVNFPYLIEGFPSSDKIYIMTDRSDVPFLDMRDGFMSSGLSPSDLRSDMYEGDVAHYGRQGHAIISHLLFSYLIDNGYICHEDPDCRI